MGCSCQTVIGSAGVAGSTGSIGHCASHAVTNDVAAWIQALEATLGLVSITLDEICQGQAAYNSLPPVIQLLKDWTKPPHSSLCQYHEDTCMLLSQWDSLLLHEDVLYRRFHYLDGTTKFLQTILPVKLCRLYVEWLHVDLGHLG